MSGVQGFQPPILATNLPADFRDLSVAETTFFFFFSDYPFSTKKAPLPFFTRMGLIPVTNLLPKKQTGKHRMNKNISPKSPKSESLGFDDFGK